MSVIICSITRFTNWLLYSESSEDESDDVLEQEHPSPSKKLRQRWVCLVNYFFVMHPYKHLTLQVSGARVQSYPKDPQEFQCCYPVSNWSRQRCLAKGFSFFIALEGLRRPRLSSLAGLLGRSLLSLPLTPIKGVSPLRLLSMFSISYIRTWCWRPT